MARRFLLFLLMSWLGLASSLRAEAPLDLIPESADIVVRLKAPEATTEKLAQFAESIEANTGKLVQARAAQLGVYISNPSLTGVDQARDWYLAVFADAKADPAVVFVIPATDADAMQKALPENVASFARGDWVLYAENKETIHDLSSSRSEAGIGTRLDERSRPVFDASDLSLYVNIDHLTDVYHDRIQKARDNAAAQLSQRAFAAPQIQGLDLSGLTNMYGDLMSGMFQALEDARGLTVGLAVGDSGVDMDMYLDVAGASPTSEFLSGQPESSMSRIGVLPEKSQVYWGASGDIASMMQFTQSALLTLTASDESGDELEKLSNQLQELDFKSLVGSLKIGSDVGGLMQSMSLVEVSPVSTARDVMRKSAELVGTIEMPMMRQETSLERDAEEFGDYKADHLIVEQTYDFGPNAPPQLQQQMEQMQQMMYGPDGNLTRYVYLDDMYLQSLGGGRGPVEETLKHIESGETNDAAQQHGSLMEKSNLLLLVDVPGIAGAFMKVAGGMFAGLGAGQPPGLPQVNQTPETSSYVGLAAAAESEGVHAELHVPQEQIRSVLTYVAMFQMMNQQQQGLR